MPLNIDLNTPLDDSNISNHLSNVPPNINLNAPLNIDLNASIEEEDHIVESEFEDALSKEVEEDMDEVDDIFNESEVENIFPGMNSTPNL